MGREMLGAWLALALGLPLLAAGCGGAGVVTPTAPSTATAPVSPPGSSDVIIGEASVESVDV